MTRRSATHWFVVHQDGQPQLATASMSRSGAIKYWLKLADETWPFWYRRGMRTQRVRITWAPAITGHSHNTSHSDTGAES